MKLKPCPFCGGEAEYGEISCLDNTYQVKCVDCLASVWDVDEDLSAIEAWNRRVSEKDKVNK